MNKLVVFFIIIVFVDVQFHKIVSNGCYTTGKYDAITLSKKSLEDLNEKFGTGENAEKSKAKDVALAVKKRYYGFFEQLETYHMKSFYPHFTCAINTAKSVISDAMENHGIFTLDFEKLNSDEVKTFNKLKLPSHLYTLIFEQRDGKIPPETTMSKHISFILRRFRKFFFNLKKYGISPMFVRFRELLNPENKLKEAELDEVYKMFSATIVRDYSFFCADHHSKIAKLLSDVNPPSPKYVVDSLFKQNPWWYYTRVHIQNMNIFLKAYYKNDKFPEIEGFPCRNGMNEDVEIPLFNKCGIEPKYTLKPR